MDGEAIFSLGGAGRGGARQKIYGARQGGEPHSESKSLREGGKRDSEEQCILKSGAGQGKTVGKWDFHKTIFSNSISLTNVVLNINKKRIQGFYSYYTS